MASGPGDFVVILDFHVCPGVHQMRLTQEGEEKRGGSGGGGRECRKKEDRPLQQHGSTQGMGCSLSSRDGIQLSWMETAVL